MGRFFSKRSLVEVVKSLAKVGLDRPGGLPDRGRRIRPGLLLGEMAVADTVRYLATTTALVMAKVAAVMIVLAAADYAFVRFEMKRRAKMTRQEVREEMKETEGDPHIKSKSVPSSSRWPAGG